VSGWESGGGYPDADAIVDDVLADARAAGSVTITSFGYLHGTAPAADIPIDLRESYRDPHVDPALRDLTAEDPGVMNAVLATPGIPALVRAVAAAVRDLMRGGGPVTVAIACAGGRHRPAVATLVAALLEASGVPVTTVHRDIEEPVVRRGQERVQ
jgi:UPF0042 nucleotide-binding protein